jgi:hypothetical protein
MKLYVSLAHNGLVRSLDEFKRLTIPQAFLMVAAFERYMKETNQNG